MEMGGGILSGHRSPILTSAICDQLAKICSPNSDLKYITIYVEDISQFFHFSTLHYVHFVKYDDAVSFYGAVSDTIRRRGGNRGIFTEEGVDTVAKF